MSTTQDQIAEFVKGLRAQRDLADKARYLTAAVRQIEDHATLTMLLRELGVEEYPTDPPSEGKVYADSYRLVGERMGHSLRALASATITKHKEASCGPTSQSTVRSSDFGQSFKFIQTKVENMGTANEEKTQLVAGYLEKLPDEHVLRKFLTPDQCPTWNEGSPLVLLGRPVKTFAGGLAPAPSYPVGKILEFTRFFGQAEREEQEKARTEDERRKEEAFERNRNRTPGEKADQAMADFRKLTTELKPITEALAAGTLTVIGPKEKQALQNLAKLAEAVMANTPKKP